MKKPLLTLVLTLLSLPVMAAGGSGWPLDHMSPDMENKASLQRGVQTYMNYCMGCHSLKFSRYERVANDLGIPVDLYDQYLKFDGDHKIGSLMTNAMATEDAKKWFGAAPPDLTLVARSKGPDWLYSYLRTFYRDPSRPYGFNNKVFPDVGMPHVLAELQGVQVCAPGSVKAENGGILRDPLTGEDVTHDESGKPLNPCGKLVVEEPGELSVEEYDQLVYDLVNFLEYVAEPALMHRERIGIYALFYLALLFVFAWLLNREYWKDVH